MERRTTSTRCTSLVRFTPPPPRTMMPLGALGDCSCAISRRSRFCASILVDGGPQLVCGSGVRGARAPPRDLRQAPASVPIAVFDIRAISGSTSAKTANLKVEKARRGVAFFVLFKFFTDGQFVKAGLKVHVCITREISGCNLKQRDKSREKNLHRLKFC